MKEETQPPPKHWFDRTDESSDELFYASPRFVEHIDLKTIQSLSDFYKDTINEEADVLDLMSSWISHYPIDLTLSRVAGLGMNEPELSANKRLTDWCVHNLNQQPELPYSDELFNYVTCAVSIQYLTSPIEVLQSVRRVLRNEGKIIIAMSHRLFPTKAVAIFQKLPPKERVELVMSYLELANFKNISFNDQSPEHADPLWIVSGEK